MERTSGDLVREFERRVESLGFELVDVRARGSGGRVSVQVRIDQPDSTPGHGVTADDCASVSRVLEEYLDESGELGSRYVLEVSSPGIERPIRRRRQWERFVGHDVRVRLPGRGMTRATIVQLANDESVVLRLKDGDELTVALEDAREATLVVDWSAVDRSLAGPAHKESQ